MNDNQIKILAAIAGVLLVVTALLYSGISFGGDSFKPGTALLIGFDPAKVSAISIASAEGGVTMRRTETGFGIDERDGYPASMKKINDLLIQCMEIKLAEKVSDSADAHANLGVADTSPEALTVKFLGEDGKPLAGFIRGKSPERGSGAWLRKLDGPITWLSAGAVTIDPSPGAWLDTRLVVLKKEDIEEVSIELAGKSATILRGSDKKPSLRNLPAGRDADETEVTEAFEALAEMNFDDVVPVAGKTLQWDGLYRCRLASGLVYLVRTAKEGDAYFAMLGAIGPQVTEIEIHQEDTDADLKEKEAVVLAINTANEINQMSERWIFKLSSWQAEKLRTTMEELLEEKE